MDFNCTQKTNGKTNALTIIIFGISNGSATVPVLITCNSDKKSYQWQSDKKFLCKGLILWQENSEIQLEKRVKILVSSHDKVLPLRGSLLSHIHRLHICRCLVLNSPLQMYCLVGNHPKADQQLHEYYHYHTHRSVQNASYHIHKYHTCMCQTLSTARPSLWITAMRLWWLLL